MKVLHSLWLEAMSHGILQWLPTWVDRPEWVEEGMNGFIAAAPTIPEITGVMERAWHAKNRWKEKGALGEKKFQTNTKLQQENNYLKGSSSCTLNFTNPALIF
jgi:hypothetical protein